MGNFDRGMALENFENKHESLITWDSARKSLKIQLEFGDGIGYQNYAPSKAKEMADMIVGYQPLTLAEVKVNGTKYHEFSGPGAQALAIAIRDECKKNFPGSGNLPGHGRAA